MLLHSVQYLIKLLQFVCYFQAKENMTRSKTIAMQHTTGNIVTDVVPYDDSRLTLKSDPDAYINASYYKVSENTKINRFFFMLNYKRRQSVLHQNPASYYKHQSVDVSMFVFESRCNCCFNLADLEFVTWRLLFIPTGSNWMRTKSRAEAGSEYNNIDGCDDFEFDGIVSEDRFYSGGCYETVA